MLTFDLDFGEILAASGGQIVSVVLFRLRNTRTSFVIQRLDDVLTQSSADLSQGAVIIVEDGRHRVREPPHRQLERAWLPPHRRGILNIIRRPSEELPPCPFWTTSTRR